MSFTDGSKYSIRWLGYNPKPNYRRVWGWLDLADGRHFAFFGTPGKRMNFKRHEAHDYGPNIDTHFELRRRHMVRKGYEQVTVSDFELEFPTFVQDLEISLTETILADSFRK